MYERNLVNKFKALATYIFNEKALLEVKKFKLISEARKYRVQYNVYRYTERCT